MLLGPRSLQCPLMWTDIINDIAQSDTRWSTGGCGGGVCVCVYVCVCVCARAWCMGEKGMVREEKIRKHGEPHLMQLMCRFM